MAGLLAAALAAPATAPAYACEGRVVTATGLGIAHQAVSDGRRLATTGADGRYVLPGGAAASPVFVIAREGWAPPPGPDGLPAFWRAGCGDFTLVRGAETPRQASLRVLVMSDPQTSTGQQVDAYSRGVIAPARGEAGIELGLTLGDVTDDVPALYPALNRATASLGVPWLHVAGNHDVDVDARDDAASLSAYQAVFGPDTYAYEARHATFVMLDNVVSLPGQRPAYVGGLREDQFEFLERYLAVAPRHRLLVVAAHIPWFDTAAEGRAPSVRGTDRERLFALLRDFPRVLLLSGHRHTQRQYFHDAGTGWHGPVPLHEYNVGAASGAYWSGAADGDGIPVSTMADGTPRGYAVLTVAPDGGYRLAWRPLGVVRSPALTGAMALHAPKVLRSGAYPAWGVYANVFMGHAGTRVEYRIGDGPWQAMTRVMAPDPRLLLENARDDLAEGLRGRDRSPEAEPSTHLWRGALETRRPPGEYRVEVRAFDDAGDEHRAHIDYRLEAWPD